jgi:hypothetical protein
MNCNDCGGFLPGGCECSPFVGRKPYTVKAVPLNPEGIHPADPRDPWPPTRTVVAEVKFKTPVSGVALPAKEQP